MAFLARESRPRDTRAASHDPIRVTARQHGYFPKTFVWRGRSHEIEAVERCWTIPGRGKFGLAGGIEQHCFRVRCAEATYQLVQDLRHNAWYIERRGAAR